jgi:hypothetical protein
MLFVVGLGIIFAAAMVVCLPLFRGDHGEAAPAGVDEATLSWERQKRDAYSAIKEADLDLRMGKLTPDDHQAIRRAEEARALEALRALREKTLAREGKKRR